VSARGARSPAVRGLVAAGLLTLAMASCSRPERPLRAAAKAAGATAPATVLAYEPRMGREIYRHDCQTCHGEGGAGDGFNAFNLDPRPRDLADPKLQRAKSDADLADAIRRGGAGVGLSALMPPWGHTLSERQIADVVAYLRTLRRPAAS